MEPVARGTFSGSPVSSLQQIDQTENKSSTSKGLVVSHWAVPEGAVRRRACGANPAASSCTRCATRSLGRTRLSAGTDDSTRGAGEEGRANSEIFAATVPSRKHEPSAKFYRLACFRARGRSVAGRADYAAAGSACGARHRAAAINEQARAAAAGMEPDDVAGRARNRA
jgi:hypothetical protein